MLLENPAHLLRDPSDLDRLASPIDVELHAPRDREDETQGPIPVVPLRLPVLPEVPEILLDQDFDDLLVFRELLGLLEELEEKRAKRRREALPRDLAVELEMPAPSAHGRFASGTCYITMPRPLEPGTPGTAPLSRGTSSRATMRTALTIAGSDSGGGAGIQADLKAFAAIGVHGTSAVTCVTAQNTRAVDSIFPLPADEVRKQLRSVLSDFDVRAAKTGMLYSADIVRAVAKGLARSRFPLVVDPVMVATVGASLEREDFQDALVEQLLPRAAIVTPNRHEAGRLAGRAIRSVTDAERAAREIRRLGPDAVLVKGGHLRGRLVDIYADGRSTRQLTGFRHDKELHGAGCTLAASIAAYLARGMPLLEAVHAARRRVASGFLSSYRVGRGVDLIDAHVVPDRYAIWQAVSDAAPRLAKAIPLELAPEVGTNLGYALSTATTTDDVCALRGRIVRVGSRLEPTGAAAFGASKHIARVILTAMRFHPGTRSATNLKYRPKNARRLRSARLAVATFDRSEEPAGVSTLEWGTERAIVEVRRIPDVIADEGAVGKEPMMRVLGTDPQDVLRKVRRIARAVAL